MPEESPLSGALCGGPARFAMDLAEAPSTGQSGAVMDLDDDIEWRVSPEPVPYADALAFMEQRVRAIREGGASECIWLLEHPPLITAGTSADPAELRDPERFPIFEAGRGGRYTYHGPGQRVGYVMLDLEKRGKDIRCFVHALEGWVIAALGDLGVEAHRAPGRIGIWVGVGAAEAKVAALGVRVRRWVTLHGFSINVAPNLDHFAAIVPCGIAEFGVTSLQELGKQNAMSAVDAALKRGFVSFLSALEAQCKES